MHTLTKVWGKLPHQAPKTGSLIRKRTALLSRASRLIRAANLDHPGVRHADAILLVALPRADLPARRGRTDLACLDRTGGDCRRRGIGHAVARSWSRGLAGDSRGRHIVRATRRRRAREADAVRSIDAVAGAKALRATPRIRARFPSSRVLEPLGDRHRVHAPRRRRGVAAPRRKRPAQRPHDRQRAQRRATALVEHLRLLDHLVPPRHLGHARLHDPPVRLPRHHPNRHAGRARPRDRRRALARQGPVLRQSVNLLDRIRSRGEGRTRLHRTQRQRTVDADLRAQRGDG